ncbi:MAG TPA: hypothetical protein DD727_07990 [Clostridiales bacterium]|nr:hypothetical protein [Clostridiales bacterium]
MKRPALTTAQQIPGQIARIGTAISLLVLGIGLACTLCGDATLYIGRELTKTSIVLFAETIAGALAFEMAVKRQR